MLGAPDTVALGVGLNNLKRNVLVYATVSFHYYVALHCSSTI